MSKKNILELCMSPDLGGLELYMAKMSKAFQDVFNVFIVTSPNSKLSAYFSKEQKVAEIQKASNLFMFWSAKKLANLIDKQEIELIHIHWTKDIPFVVLAKLLSKTRPKIVQTRHMTMTRFKDDFYHKWLYSNINTIHAVTNQVKEQLEHFIPADVCPRIAMAYLGVDEPVVDEKSVMSLKEKYKLGESFVVGIVGRIEKGKGQHIVLEALAKLKNIDVKVVIVGAAMSKAYLQELKVMVQELGINKRVRFSGFTQEVDSHMCLCDVTVLATFKETFGLVVVESMANGVPVIATNCGGPLEIIEDGVDGLLFDRTSEDLAKKITLLYENKKLQETLAKAAKQKAKEKFDKDKQMLKIYEVISES